MKEKIENLGKVAVTIEEGYWDIKKPYDKLTIVEREGTGTTFISRKPVPSGTSILNRKYWIKFSKWSDIPYEITQKFGDSEELAISQKTLTNKFSDVETEIKEGDESLDRRLRAVEVHERIMIDGGELEVATGYDLEHPESPRQEAAVPTVRAILDASDDEPHLNSTKRFINSDNLAKMYGYYLDNLEFIYLLLDSEYHIILGVKTNGDIVFGIGVPSQIKEYFETKFQELFDEKVDKVEGKSLIDEEYAEGIHYIENPEFVEVKLDKDERIIEAIMLDGTKLLPAGYEIGGNIVKTISNPEYLAAWLDSVNHILFALKADGDVIFGCGIPSQIKEHVGELIKPFEDLFYYENNPEFIDVKLDSEGKILEGTKINGVKYLGSLDIDGITYFIVSNPEWLKAIVDSNNKIICGIKTNGTFCVVDIDFLDSSNKIKEVFNHFDALDNPEFLFVELDKDKKVLGGRKTDGTKFENVGLDLYGTVFKGTNDPEGRMEVKTDSDGKIISYRKEDGTLVENAGIKTNHFELTEQGMTDFQQALKNAGFNPGGEGDWSDKKVVELPEPKSYGILNINIGGVPYPWGSGKDGEVEYYDKSGNYFKKSCHLEGQGQTSKIFGLKGGKGNYTLDITDGSEIKFGDWVPQDSWHLKGCAKDVTRGILTTSYKFAYTFQEYLDAKPNRVLSKDDSEITTTHASGDRFTDWMDDARCLPDGFPLEVYIDGNYWGLYAIQLKKHRKNYSMKKSDYTSFFLDTDHYMSNNLLGGFWTGDIWWNRFEIRGPKDLICMDGSKYDGDNPKELIDSTSEYYDPSNKVHKGSSTVKSIITSFPTKYQQIKTLIDTGTQESIVEAKELFNQYFDYNACMLVYIFNCTMLNGDSIIKNTMWGTYKNGKIAPMLWDLDGMYGEGWMGTSAMSPGAYLWTYYGTAAWPLGLFWNLYKSEIKTAYAELRHNSVISIESWKAIVFGWIKRIGTEAYDRDIERWSETPSYRENLTNSDYWEEIGFKNVPIWDENTQYDIGDEVGLLAYEETSYVMAYRAISPSGGDNPQCPVTDFYNLFPYVGGYYNSPKRMEKWMEEQIKLCDVAMEYFKELLADFTAYRSNDPGYEIQCVNMNIDSTLSKEYNYIQGYITRHESVIEGQTVSTYTIDGGAETPEDTSKTYTTVRTAIEAAANQPVDVPSENVYYIKARAKNITYRKK